MYFNYTDWMLAYLIDAKSISIPATYVLFVAILVLHGFLAALGVGALVLNKRLGVAIAVTAGVGITNLVLMALQAHAYNHFGTFAEYHAGTAPELAAVPRAQLGMTISGAMIGPVVVALLAVRLIAGRKAAKASEAAPPASGAAPA
jgi:hypothetical protein